jgi:hypothetical protein
VTDIIHDPGRGAPLAKVRARAAVRRTSVTLKNYPQLCCVLRARMTTRRGPPMLLLPCHSRKLSAAVLMRVPIDDDDDAASTVRTLCNR